MTTKEKHEAKLHKYIKMVSIIMKKKCSTGEESIFQSILKCES